MRDLYEFNGLNQFDSNPTDDPDLMEMIAETWIEKALYYALRKVGSFSWRESWVVVDGIKYNISINNTSIVGERDCAGLSIELRKLREKIDKAIEEIKELPTRGSVGMDGTICRNEVLEILKRHIGEDKENE